MNMHANLNMSFDLPGRPGCGARRWSVIGFDGKYSVEKLSVSRPRKV